MKTRTIALLLIAAVLSGLALAQVPAVSAVLAPLSGRDREIVVETFHTASQHDQMLSDLFAPYPTAVMYFKGRSDAYEQASQFVANYGTPPFPAYQPAAAKLTTIQASQ